MKNELDNLFDEDNVIYEDNINEIEKIYSLISRNKKRTVNKLLFFDNYFYLEFSKNTKKITINYNKKNIVFSTIPNDYGRWYIQKMACLYINNKEQVTNFLINEKKLICEYIKKSNPSSDHNIEDCFNNIINNPLMTIQVAGRIFQHYDTGPIIVEKKKKFLYYENSKIGIQEYIYQFILFVTKANIFFNQLKLNGINLNMLPKFFTSDIFNNKKILNNLKLINQKIDEKNKVPLIPTKINSLENSQHDNSNNLEIYFPIENYNEKERKYNDNKINVVSDIHINKKTNNFPFINNNFNIIAGDIIDKTNNLPDLNGICVIGNHEILTLSYALPNSIKNLMKQNERVLFEKIQKNNENKILDNFSLNEDYYICKMFSAYNDKDIFWHDMPIGNHEIYKFFQDKLQKHLPNLKVLNNESYIKDNIRYIGLTIPIRHIAKKKILQDFIEEELTRLLGNDREIKTIIISHAPLFNELSLLTSDKSAYIKEYNCENQKIIDLFKKFNIIGVIHGHHHIPATQGRYRYVNFAGKKLFVICSIYSNINSGIDLTKFIDDNNQNTKKEFIKLNDNELQSIKKIININFDYLFNENKKIKPKKVKIKKEVKEKIIIDKFKTYSYDDKIEEIKGLTEEFSKTQNDYIYVLDKRINGIRFKKRFLNKNDAIDELNKIIINSKNNTI